jgi:hypothetical protein
MTPQPDLAAYWFLAAAAAFFGALAFAGILVVAVGKVRRAIVRRRLAAYYRELQEVEFKPPEGPPWMDPVRREGDEVLGNGGLFEDVTQKEDDADARR